MDAGRLRRATFYRYERDTLEAIDRAGELRSYEISDEAGWPGGSCAAAITRLRHFGLIYKAASAWRLTDRGKIVLAITRGKEMQDRSHRRAA
jgi:predicted transcriptional regulator